jgi:glycosyltransferase involved in cell wall biosynthesis
MFLVFVTLAKELAKTSKVEILVNKEHWGIAELSEIAQENINIRLTILNFQSAETVLKNILKRYYYKPLVRKIVFALGNLINVAVSPFIIVNLMSYLMKLRSRNLISHNGGWPGSHLSRWIMMASFFSGYHSRVLVLHNYVSILPKRFKFLLKCHRNLESFIADLVCTSKVFVSDDLRLTYQNEVFHKKLTTIHNGLANERKKSVGSSFDSVFENDLPTIGFIGALYPYKGPDFLLKSFRYVEDNCQLVLLGPYEKEYFKYLSNLAQECKNPVHFLGFQSDVDSFLNKIDFLVVPSVAFESFGMVILEAMRAKKAVICTDFGGMKEIVVDGETGLVAISGDTNSLANAISLLLNNPDLAKKMGQNGYERYIAEFSVSKMASKYLELTV